MFSMALDMDPQDVITVVALASFPGLHAQLLSLAVQKALFILQATKAGCEGLGTRLRLRDPRAVGVARQFVQTHFSPTKMKLVKTNLLDAKQGR